VADAQRDAERIAALLDRMTADFASELDAVLVSVTGRVRALLRELETQPDGRLSATLKNLRRAVRLRNDILQILEQAGFTAFVTDAIDEPLDRLAAHVLKASDVSADDVDLDILAALKQIRLADLLQVGEDVAVTLWRTTVDGVLGLRPVVELVNDVADLLDISARRARTIYDTAISTFTRQVAQVNTTGEPDEAFFYVGPVDSKIREFCLDHVGKVFTRDRIDQMDNGQLPNVFLTGGGYNCRHMWRRVSPLDFDLLKLVNTDQVEPGVESRIEDSQLAAAGA
jgi:hypothetical protein